MSDIVERLRREATIMGMVGGDPVSRDMLRDAAAEIERLREERRWIPVGERLPEEGVDVLVSRDGRCHVAGYETFRNGNVHWTLASFESVTPTHWMPLPAPPEDKDE